MRIAGYGDLGHLVQPDRVHGSVYTDPALYAEEMRSIVGLSRVHVEHESEIAQPARWERPWMRRRVTDGGIVESLSRMNHDHFAERVRPPDGAARHCSPLHRRHPGPHDQAPVTTLREARYSARAATAPSSLRSLADQAVISVSHPYPSSPTRRYSPVRVMVEDRTLPGPVASLT